MLRLIIYITFFIIGYDVWLLPNLMIDNRKFIESLSPIIGYYPRDDSKYEIIFRVCMLLFFLGVGVFCFQHPEEFFEAWNMFKSLFNFIETWGYNKLTNMHVKIYFLSYYLFFSSHHLIFIYFFSLIY